MGKCRNDKENDCDETNCRDCVDDASPPKESHSKSSNGIKTSSESLLKIRTRDGWVFRWTTPQKPLVRSIIPGPFLRPKLVHARPYVVTSNCKDCKDCTEKSVPVERKLRNGIPDPWIEYLAWKEKRSPKDVRCSWEYMWLTDYIWESRGLAMVQGIPDPWRVGLDCSCLDVIEEKQKKQKRIRAKDSRSSVKRDLRAKATAAAEEKLAREKREERNAYERVKDKMTELEDELRLRDAELALLRGEKATAAVVAASKSKPARKSKERVIDKAPVKKISCAPKEKVVLRCDKVPHASKPKVVKKCNDKVVEKVIEKPKVKKVPPKCLPKFVPCSPPKCVPKSIPCSPPKSKPCSPRKCEPKFIPNSPPKCVPKSIPCSTKKVSFDNVKDRIKKCNEDILKIRKDTNLAQQKIKTLKGKKDDNCAPCPGKCGRVMRNEKLLKSIKLNEDTDSISSVKDLLKEINERIAITKNVLNSPDMKITENKKSTKRERGAGDNPCEVIDLQQPSLFSRRRRCDNIEIPIDTTEIPDHVDYEARCYWEASRRNRASRESEQVLIVEAFSEQD